MKRLDVEIGTARSANHSLRGGGGKAGITDGVAPQQLQLYGSRVLIWHDARLTVQSCGVACWQGVCIEHLGMEAGMMAAVVFYLYVGSHEISVVGLDRTQCEEVRDTIVVLASSAQPPHFVSGCEPTRRRFDPPVPYDRPIPIKWPG